MSSGYDFRQVVPFLQTADYPILEVLLGYDFFNMRVFLKDLELGHCNLFAYTSYFLHGFAFEVVLGEDPWVELLEVVKLQVGFKEYIFPLCFLSDDINHIPLIQLLRRLNKPLDKKPEVHEELKHKQTEVHKKLNELEKGGVSLEEKVKKI